MAVRSYLDQQIQNEAAARAAGAPVTPGSFTDIASREVNPQFVQRALGTIPANTPPPAPAYQQTFLSGLLAQLQNAAPEQQQVARFAPQLQGLLGPVLQQEHGRDPNDPEQVGRDYQKEYNEKNEDGTYKVSVEDMINRYKFNQNIAPALAGIFSPFGAAYDKFGPEPTSEFGKFLESLNPSGSQGPRRTMAELNKAFKNRNVEAGIYPAAKDSIQRLIDLRSGGALDSSGIDLNDPPATSSTPADATAYMPSSGPTSWNRNSVSGTLKNMGSRVDALIETLKRGQNYQVGDVITPPVMRMPVIKESSWEEQQEKARNMAEDAIRKNRDFTWTDEERERRR